jgi:hypothetical protein
VRAALAGIAAGLALGCASAPAEPPAPVTEETHRAAAAAVLALAADPGARLELFEGGFTADAWTWRTEERVVWDDLHGVGLLGPPLPRAPRVVRERRLEGPMRTAFRFGDLVSAAPYAMLLATDVELRVRGEAEPFLLDVGGREAARRLAAALDVLIRARDAAP